MWFRILIVGCALAIVGCSKKSSSSAPRRAVLADEGEDKSNLSDNLGDSLFGGAVLNVVLDLNLTPVDQIEPVDDVQVAPSQAGSMIMKPDGTTTLLMDEASSTLEVPSLDGLSEIKQSFMVADHTFWIDDGSKFTRYTAKDGQTNPEEMASVAVDLKELSEGDGDPNLLAIEPDFFAMQKGSNLGIARSGVGGFKAFSLKAPVRKLDSGSSTVVRLRSAGRVEGNGSYWFLTLHRMLLLRANDDGSFKWLEFGYKTNLDGALDRLSLNLTVGFDDQMTITGQGVAVSEGKVYLVNGSAIAGNAKETETVETDTPDPTNTGEDIQFDEEEGGVDFKATILPIANASCQASCHGWAGEQTGWMARKDQIINRLSTNDMPPSTSDSTLSDVDRQLLLDWLQGR